MTMNLSEIRDRDKIALKEEIRIKREKGEVRAKRGLTVSASFASSFSLFTSHFLQCGTLHIESSMWIDQHASHFQCPIDGMTSTDK